MKNLSKILIGLALIFAISILKAQTPNNEYKLGVKFLTDTEYNNLPKANWGILKTHSNIQSISRTSTSDIIMLTNPSIGDQGSEGSCVGWAVGYTATSILAYPKYNSWSLAKRSPSYVYNQIKVGADCS